MPAFRPRWLTRQSAGADFRRAGLSLTFGIVWLVLVIPAPRPGGGFLAAGIAAWINGLEATAQGS